MLHTNCNRIESDFDRLHISHTSRQHPWPYLINKIILFLFRLFDCQNLLDGPRRVRIDLSRPSGSLNSYKPGVPFVGHRQTVYIPRCDATERGVTSGAILFAQRNFIEK